MSFFRHPGGKIFYEAFNNETAIMIRNAITHIGLYYRTVKHLEPVQIYGRLWHRLFRPRPDTRPSPAPREMTGRVIPFCAREASMTGPDEFVFLGRQDRVRDRSAWHTAPQSLLWRYNLHYFDDLNAHGADTRTHWHKALVSRWIRENPPGHGVGWDPYPTSLRIVNWIKWISRGHAPGPDMVHSLAVQARWLQKRLEYHLIGNHLLANAKALVFSGLFFQGAAFEHTNQKGMALLARELPVQVFSDGGHFEHSPMYHLIVLEDLLDLVNLHHGYETSYPDEWLQICGKMTVWSRGLRHPDGGIPFFNDAAFGIAPAPAALDRYAQKLGMEIPGDPGEGVAHFRETGYVRLQMGNAVLLADMAPVGPDSLPAHAHADTLSFELSIGGQRVVVNGGTSEYGAGSERHRQRSTMAHSTLILDNENSSEVWGGFRVARRARVIEAVSIEAGERAGGACIARGAHDGYARFRGNPVHGRQWTLLPGELRVADDVRGKGVHTVDIVFQFHPGFGVADNDKNSILITKGTTGESIANLCFDSGRVHAYIEEYIYCPRFGVRVPGFRIRLNYSGVLPFSHETIMRWYD